MRFATGQIAVVQPTAFGVPKRKRSTQPSCFAKAAALLPVIQRVSESRDVCKELFEAPLAFSLLLLISRNCRSMAGILESCTSGLFIPLFPGFLVLRGPVKSDFSRFFSQKNKKMSMRFAEVQGCHHSLFAKQSIPTVDGSEILLTS